MTEEMEEEKYVVFKKDEWEAHLLAIRQINDPLMPRDLPPLPEQVEDAVVLRLQDVFTRPALYAYANGIQNAVDILMGFGGDLMAEECKRLITIADRIIDIVNADENRQTKLPD